MKTQIYDEEREPRKAAIALNYCAMSISTIIDYQDKIVLTQEYDAIVNNINMQEIVKDEALHQLYKKLCRILTYLKIKEGDEAWIQRAYENNMKNAIFNSISQFNVVLAGGNPWSMVIGAIHQVCVTYMNYRRNINQYREGRDKALWEIEKDAIRHLNELQIAWIDASWRLADRYNFPDEWRLTQVQIDHYIQVLKDTDDQRALERLDHIANAYDAYPPFWYYRASKALSTAAQFSQDGDKANAHKYYLMARSHYDRFDEVYMPILRNDKFRIQTSLDKIRMLNPVTDMPEIRNHLEHLCRHATHNFDVLQFVAIHYLSIHDVTSAIALLRTLINEDRNKNMNGQLLSRIYLEQKNDPAYDALKRRIGAENVVDHNMSLSASSLQDLIQNAAQVTAKRISSLVLQKSRTCIDQYIDDDETDCEKQIKYVRVTKHNKWMKEGLDNALTELYRSISFEKYFGVASKAVWGQFTKDCSKIVDEVTSEFVALLKKAEDIHREMESTIFTGRLESAMVRAANKVEKILGEVEKKLPLKLTEAVGCFLLNMLKHIDQKRAGKEINGFKRGLQLLLTDAAVQDN